MSARQHRGVYIVIEGPPGSGKTAVSRLVCSWLSQQHIPTYTGYNVPLEPTESLAEPLSPARTEIYASNTARLRQQDLLRDALEHGMVCILDGNYLSSFTTHYYGRSDVRDYTALNNLCLKADGDLRPDMTVVLQAPAAVLAERLAKRAGTDPSYQPSIDYLERVVAGYTWEVKQRQLAGVDAGLDLAVVMSAVQQLVAPLLQDVSKVSYPAAAKLPAANTTGPTAQSGATPISELLAARGQTPTKLSAKKSKDTQNQPGQLPGEPALKIPNASTLLRLAATDIIAGTDPELPMVFSAETENKTKSAHTYYTPITLSETVKTAYTKTMVALSNIHHDMAQRLTAYIQKTTPDATEKASRAQALEHLRPILPVAAASTLSVAPLSSAKAEQYAAAFCASDLIELQSFGHRLLEQAPPQRAEAVIKQSATFLEGAATINRIATEAASTMYAVPPSHPVKLISYQPRNEADAIIDSLYENSDLEYSAVKSTGEQLPYETKMKLLGALKHQAHLRAGTMRSPLASVSYTFDIAASFLEFLKLQQCAGGSMRLTLQPLTPRFGYKTPDIIEEAGLTEYFDKCFDLSLQLHSALQSAGHHQEACYGVLLGHIIRFKLDITHEGMMRLTAAPQENSMPLINALRDECAAVHPTLWQA